ncbi:MAG TPA: WHG domain-containing protein [Ktedonobacteraceae bacterium]|nr:WHG domain-containing protein [Ktedonobacteraceae bacterium]
MATRVGLDREMVVRTAAELADSKGLEEVSLATLAARLGVRSPTLYHYVDGLAGLRRELALLGTRELGQRLGRAVMGKAGDEAVRALASAYRVFVNEHPGLYAATVHAAEPDDTALQAAQTEVVDIALRSLSAYHLSQEDAIHVVRMLRSLVHGFATLEHSGGFGIPLDIDETFERLQYVFLQGLSAGNNAT